MLQERSDGLLNVFLGCPSVSLAFSEGNLRISVYRLW